ncbi:MAG TPA: ATP-dependent Clp protease proteolytic subunit [Candidatus Paceibacterota bacterium]|nr:ATP-dependent Clp protease proteolytic subunit [Candidatus Paceibacterota bacterium]
MKRGAIVTIYGSIDERVECRVMDSLGRMAKDPPKLLTLVLNSPGGFFVSSFTIQMALEDLPMPVEGLVFGQAASGCFSILQRCSWRAAMADASLTHHAPTMTGWRIDHPEYEHYSKLLRELFELELEHLSRRSGQPIKQWREWASDERRFTAEEAFGLGIIDAIYYRVPESLKENL